ncbi:hypothetical protein HanIR_Chr10g0472521 [Helianthus annuus]|nr:hypothetical protein HanIR_Chr10g0472521 [Helianthus annuus]
MESKLINLNNNNNLFLGYRDSFSSRESDIEMISIDSLSSYTSLKDLLRLRLLRRPSILQRDSDEFIVGERFRSKIRCCSMLHGHTFSR